MVVRVLTVVRVLLAVRVLPVVRVLPAQLSLVVIRLEQTTTSLVTLQQ